MGVRCRLIEVQVDWVLDAYLLGIRCRLIRY